MAYVISGQAGDEALARCEWLGNQMAAVHSGTTINFDPKHPSEWEEYVDSLARLLDVYLSETVRKGPIVWTPEGKVFTAEEFSKLARSQCVVNVVANFPAIAQHHLREVEAARARALVGPPLRERLADARAVDVRSGTIRTTTYVSGVAFETWAVAADPPPHCDICATSKIAHVKEWECVQHLNDTHLLALVDAPLVPKQCALLPLGCTESELEEGSDEMSVKVRPRSGPIVPEDVAAIQCVLEDLRAVVTLQLLPDGCDDVRRPIATHLQVMPFPLVDRTDAPLAPWLARQAEARPSKVDFFGFSHHVEWLPAKGADGNDLTRGLEAALNALGSTCADFRGDIVFSREWILAAPIRAPASDEAKIWKVLPPPLPEGLVGLVVIPQVVAEYPEAAAAWALSGPAITKERILSTIGADPMAVLRYWRPS